MRELAFAGLTEGGALLLTTGDGQQYSLAVDERLVAAVRGDRPRLGQLSIALEGATPRDIQTRVRHGQSPAEISEQTGIPLERIERFAGPPLAEREHIAQRAGATEVRRSDGDEPLRVLVHARLLAESVDEDAVSWDAWRRDDGRWTVLARWPGGGAAFAAGEASWVYDATDRTVDPEDDVARLLQEGLEPEPAPARIHLVVPDEGPDDLDGPASPWGEPSAEEVDRQRSSWGDQSDPDTALTAVVDRYSGDVVDLVTGPPVEPDTPLDDLLHTDPGVAPAHARPSRRRRKSAETEPKPPTARSGKGRATVPSWDEILFGSRKPPTD